MFDNLSAEARTLVREAVSRLAAAYHAEDGFVHLKLEEDRVRPRLRESMYYALGGLMLEEPGAAERAERICGAVLDTQLDAPGEVWHGAFRHPDAPAPPAMPLNWRDVSLKARYQADVAWERITARFGQLLRGETPETRERAEALLQTALRETVPVAWATYEPNTREFIGITLAMMLEHFERQLSPELVNRIAEAGRLLMTGAAARAESDFTPLNTNIQILYIFLLDWFGNRLGREDWAERAVTEARKLLESYREFHSAAEFNSPTYYGVDLSMIGFWRRYGHSPELRALGEELETGIWQDMADFYNPALRNVCGPYSRCYELEMSLHTCLYDLMYLGLGEKRFPRHPFSIESYGNPLLALGRVTVPETVVPLLLEPREERVIRRQFRELSERGDPDRRHALCTATAWIRPDIMAGALSGSENTSHQLHPLVMFWRAGQGMGTLRMLRCLPDGRLCHLHTVLFDGRVEPGRAEMAVRNLCGQPAEVFLEVQAPGLREEMLGESLWDLPGLRMTVRANKTRLRVTRTGADTFRVTYALPPEEQDAAGLRMTMNPVRKDEERIC